MTEQSILKSLHVCLGVNVKAYDSNLNEIQEYIADKVSGLQYNEIELIKSVENETYNCFILPGGLNEVFLLHNFKDKYYIFGPIKINCLSFEKIFTQYFKEQNICVKFKQVNGKYLKEKTAYTIEDIKGIIKLVNYFFEFDENDLSFKPVHNYVLKLQKILDDAGLDELLFIENETEKKKVEYEKNY
ncbi:hypothetical protein [Staphylococcus sp. EZ-P03]|uniref:hypothetical protein n=1 Tax=Staphylococcus sp. EZ-P03 TaxID=2282739 RepID=UPI000DF86691|nr:hypothetical protein [Staphylococcus sp. EZ-P03]